MGYTCSLKCVFLPSHACFWEATLAESGRRNITFLRLFHGLVSLISDTVVARPPVTWAQIRLEGSTLASFSLDELLSGDCSRHFARFVPERKEDF